MNFAERERESSKLVSNFCVQRKARGTIKYLVVVGLLIGFFDTGSEIGL